MVDTLLEYSPPNVFDATCPSRQVLDLLADKWTVLVIAVLARGTRRYSELQRTINGVSQKMLTQTLRRMETDGLVERTVYPVVPPMVEYRLTPLGQTLVEPIGTLCRWAQDHLPEVFAARACQTSARDAE